jgi:hypothetical protein
MDCMASNAAAKNGLVLSSLPAASGILVQSRPARRPNVSLIWQATQIAEPARTLDRKGEDGEMP